MSETKTPAAPTRKEFVPLIKVQSIAELFSHPDMLDRINKAVPNHLNGERMLRTMVTACQKVPKLAQCSPMSMLGACITLATLGLEPNTPLGLAHLIPFDVNKWNKATRQFETVRTDVQVIIGYQGYLELIYRAEKVKSLHCDVVWQDEVDAGRFSYEHGTNKHLMHKPLAKERKPGEEPVYAYMYAELKNGGEEFTVMTRADIHRIRSRSQGFQAAMRAYDRDVQENKDPMKNKVYREAPWIRDFLAMFKKTPLREGQKWLPKSPELAAAIALDADGSKIDFAKINSSDMVLDGTYEEIDDDQQPEQPAKAQPQAATEKPAETAKTSPPPKAQASEPKPTSAAPVQERQPDPPAPAEGTIYPMFNHLAEEEDGPFGPEKNPAEFAKNYRQIYNNTPEEHRTALWEANEDAIERSMKVSREAKDFFNSIRPAAEGQEEDIFYVANKKSAAGVWDQQQWVKDAKALISKFAVPEEFARFSDINADTISKLTKTAQTLLGNYIADRKKILSGSGDERDNVIEGEVITGQNEMPDDSDIPFPGEEQQVHAQAQPKDEFVDIYETFMDAFSQAQTLGDLSAINGNVAMKVQHRRLKEARPDLVEKLGEAYKARERQLSLAMGQ